MTPSQPPDPGLFRNPGFRAVWTAGIANGAVRWLELVVIGIWVFQQTGSPFLTSLSASLRLLPMALCGPLMGSLAQRIDRRRLYMGLSLAAAAASVGQCLLALAGFLPIWLVMAGCFVAGIYWSADFPVRRVLLGDVSGEERGGQSLVWDSLMNNGTRMVGPMIGGLMFQAAGMPGVFLFSFLATSLAWAMVRGVRTPPSSAEAPDLPGPEGLRSLLARPAVLLVLAVTVVFNLFGFPNSSMVPVVGEARLALSAGAIGLLASCEGLGATLGSLALSVVAREAWFRRIFWTGILLIELGVLAFALSPTPAVAALALFTLGLGMAGFTSMQTTLVYISVPPRARSQALGLVSFCVGAAPLGILNIGALTTALGVTPALVLMSATGLACLGALAMYLGGRISQ